MESRQSRSAGVRAAYLMLDTFPAALALPAASVLGVFRATDWNAESPLPLGTLVPIRFAASDPASVLRIGNAEQSIVALVSGVVRVEYLASDALLVMPSLRARGFGTFSELILAEGKPSALVVNIDALLQLHRELGT